jgi:hypothetical protein
MEWSRMDVELVIGFSFVFSLALVFLIIAQGFKKVAKPFFYVASGFMFFWLAPLYVVLEQTYAFIGWVFMIPAVFAWGFAGISFFELYKKSAMEDWQKNEDEAEP